MKTKYPFQVDSIVHKSSTAIRTFGMEARLFSPVEENESREPAAPLEMHEGYSVFKGTLILKEGTKKQFTTFNIPAKEVPYIHKKTSMIMTEALNKKLKPIKRNPRAENEETSPAYMVKITAGKLKGKTPAQVLGKEGNKEALENQKKWLLDNLEKYPQNKLQIDAIENAFALYAEGTLIKANEGEAETEELPIVTIYSCPPKNIKPLDSEGRYTIYEVSITYDASKNMPFQIKVMNCFAPVDRSKGNEINMSKSVDRKDTYMSLGENEWFTMIDSMLSQKKMFESLTYPEQLNVARKINDENWKNADKEKK